MAGMKRRDFVKTMMAVGTGLLLGEAGRDQAAEAPGAVVADDLAETLKLLHQLGVAADRAEVSRGLGENYLDAGLATAREHERHTVAAHGGKIVKQS